MIRCSAGNGRAVLAADLIRIGLLLSSAGAIPSHATQTDSPILVGEHSGVLCQSGPAHSPMEGKAGLTRNFTLAMLTRGFYLPHPGYHDQAQQRATRCFSGRGGRISASGLAAGPGPLAGYAPDYEGNDKDAARQQHGLGAGVFAVGQAPGIHRCACRPLVGSAALKACACSGALEHGLHAWYMHLGGVATKLVHGAGAQGATANAIAYVGACPSR